MSIKKYTCFSCGYTHEKVECDGILHCPNALCLGAGGAWFRNSLYGYEDDEFGLFHTVDEEEWLRKGREYNKANKINRKCFRRKRSNEKDARNTR
jgi:hypothetical protein